MPRLTLTNDERTQIATYLVRHANTLGVWIMSGSIQDLATLRSKCAQLDAIETLAGKIDPETQGTGRFSLTTEEKTDVLNFLAPVVTELTEQIRSPDELGDIDALRTKFRTLDHLDEIMEKIKASIPDAS